MFGLESVAVDLNLLLLLIEGFRSRFGVGDGVDDSEFRFGPSRKELLINFIDEGSVGSIFAFVDHFQKSVTNYIK